MSPVRRFGYVLFFSLIWMSCDRGTALENLPPETYLFLDEINLTGENRLNSVVRLHWHGEDQDGYVAGYELSFDAQTWVFTEATDSTFRFDLPVGRDTTDISFYVRAVDNDEVRDPDPAFLLVPIRNQPPVARFDTVNQIPDTVFSVWSTTWTLSDPDGVETLDSVFIRLNDGPWNALPRSLSFLTFLPENPGMAGTQAVTVFEGPSAQTSNLVLPGAVVGGNNTMYLRVRDIAGTFSEVDTSEEFFLRTQTGDLLLVDDHANTTADQLYREELNALYPAYDLLNMTRNRPPFWDPTFGLLLQVYDKVFWYSDAQTIDDQLSLELASNSIQEFLNEGGKLFITVKFPGEYNNPEFASRSTIFGFSPLDSLSSSSGQARIAADSLVRPVGTFSGLAPLRSAGFITGVDPFYPKNPANVLLEADLTLVGGWTGPRNVAARTTFSNGETNQIFVSVELHELNDDPAALRALLDRILNQEFNW